MVFIEQPCGVGFSYSDQSDPYATGGDYVTDDATAAKDNYALVQAFLDVFPQYRANDVRMLQLLFFFPVTLQLFSPQLYIASESYGGNSTTCLLSIRCVAVVHNIMTYRLLHCCRSLHAPALSGDCGQEYRQTGSSVEL